MGKRVSRLDVYELLIGTHRDCGGYKLCAAKISKIYGVSRQYISKLIKELIIEGYIVCDNPRGNPKCYSATPKIFDGGKLLDANGYESTASGRRPGYAVQKARYEICIEREYTDFLKRTNKWKWGNCPCRNYKVKIFDNFNAFEFRKVGKRKLQVIVPSMFFKKEELTIARHTLFWIAYEALKWFAKKAKIRFNWTSLHLCQKPHITSPVKSAWAKQVAQDFSLNIDGKMLDSSGSKENWECQVFDERLLHAVDNLENWDPITSLQGDMSILQRRMDSLEFERFPALQQSIDKILNETMNLKNILTPQQKSDDQQANPSYG